MSYEFYKVLHLVGVLGIFLSLGALTLHIMNSGEKKFSHRRWVMITHGIGMLLVFVAGFGLMARLNIMGSWPGWIWTKLGFWLVLGVAPAFILRMSKAAGMIWVGIWIVGGLAAYLARFKPF
ncbi:MAG: hypothetical protein KDD22_02770 [Bdellovibrionales bacterium]|nr:hypothetical protein [Bdellovibrionales bacterium]